MYQFLSEAGGIIGFAIEGTGILFIGAGFCYAFFSAIRNKSAKNKEELLREFRHDIGLSMLVGLDFLVAGDIIRTVTVVHSPMGVLSLGLIVLIRTLLVFTIHLEVEGRWPWQAKLSKQGDP
ncbi:MAG: DUF1622 domain-containing protein [Deltaproteobacteria bacterium]|nr:DUF1622 domain-containing protein [Deltaproteobacteria bacterium]